VQATPRRKALTVRDIRRAHRASLSSVAAIGSDVGGGAGGYVNGEGDGSNKKGGDLGNGTGDGSAKDANDTGKGGSAKSNDRAGDIEEGDGDGDDDDEGSSRRTGRLYRMPTLNKLPSQISELSMNVSRRAHSLAHLFPFDVVDLMRPLEIKKWEIFERNADKAVRPRRLCATALRAPRHRHRGRLLTALWPACLAHHYPGVRVFSNFAVEHHRLHVTRHDGVLLRVWQPLDGILLPGLGRRGNGQYRAVSLRSLGGLIEGRG
jgi:hypothetical protein